MLIDVRINEDGDQEVFQEIPTPEDVPVVFSATDIRKEDTGVHAEISIEFDGFDTYTVCNVKRDPDRGRLINKAHKTFGGSLEEAEHVLPKIKLIQLFDNFCKKIWATKMRVSAPTDIQGTTDVGSVLYTLKPHVLTGGGTIMFGKPGKGKSFTGMMMALAVQYGTNHYWGTDKGNALFVNLERPDRTMPPRIGAVGKALGIENAKLPVLDARGSSLKDVHSILEAYVKTNETKFVVIDSISRAGQGDMKEDKVATKTIDMLNNIGVSWLAIAHTPKYDETIYYGNSQYEAGADVMLRHTSTVIDDVGSIALLLEVTKANDMPVPKPMGLHYSFDELGLNSIRFAKKEEVASLETEPNLYEGIKDLLHDFSALSATSLASKLNVSRKEITDQLKIMFSNSAIVSVGKEGNEKTYGLKHYE
tara:strand:+ start:747 stop:2006 length:1260 start_codon:yes stop_codon:yes gene_type:complete